MRLQGCSGWDANMFIEIHGSSASLLEIAGAKEVRVHIRVGGLPQNPKPPLDYQLIFSVEGLINEYIERARVIRGGKIVEVESMTEIESPSGLPW